MTSKRMLANAFGQIRFYIKIEPDLRFSFMLFSTFSTPRVFFQLTIWISSDNGLCKLGQNLAENSMPKNFKNNQKVQNNSDLQI